MASRSAHQSTVTALLRAKNGHNLDAVVGHYKFAVSKGTLSRCLNGESVSEYAENDIRDKLGLPPIKSVVVEACPDCGAAHVGRCYNKPVLQVVVLSVGERVAKAGKPRKRKARKTVELPPDLWQMLNGERERMGLSWAAYIEDLAIDARCWRAPHD